MTRVPVNTSNGRPARVRPPTKSKHKIDGENTNQRRDETKLSVCVRYRLEQKRLWRRRRRGVPVADVRSDGVDDEMDEGISFFLSGARSIYLFSSISGLSGRVAVG